MATRVTFKVATETKFGDKLLVVGSFQEKPWDLQSAPALTTQPDAYPVWSVQLELQPSTEAEYKYVIVKKDGGEKWEPFKGNRQITVPAEETTKDDGKFGHLDSKPSSNGYNPAVDNLKAPSPAFRSSPAFSDRSNGSPAPDRASPAPSDQSDGGQGNQAPTNEDEFVDIIFKENQSQKSWRQKLEFVRNCVTGKDGRFVADQGHMVYLAVYLQFLSAGEISCQEDGRHFRPNHLADNARAIDDSLSKFGRSNPSLLFVIRKMYPLVPSYAAAFTCSVPLTRIRDIAHRGDIPRDLKEIIKHQLQNKLHRCAGPEDLVKAEEVLNRITAPGANYSGSFVHEFKIFFSELKEFFNARGLDERLQEIVDKGEMDGDGIKLKDDFLWEKNNPGSDRLVVLRKLTALRKHMSSIVDSATEGGETIQRIRLAEIKLEEYAFVVVSELINGLEREQDLPWQRSMEALALTCSNVGMGGVNASECQAIEAEVLSILKDAPGFNNPGALLRLKAVLERGRRLAEEHSQSVLDLFLSRAGKLGRKLGVNDHAVRVFCEGLVRSHLVFQLSKILSIVLRKVRVVGNMPPWDALVTGVAVGRLVRCETMEEVEKVVNSDKSPDQFVVFLKRAEGDEEIPKRVAGVVLSHELPHLSHLGVRARQEGVVFATIDDDSDALKRLNDSLGSNPGLVTLSVSADSSCSCTKGGQASSVAPKKPAAADAASAPKHVKFPEATLQGKPCLFTLPQVTSSTGGAKADGARKLNAMAVESKGLAAFSDPPGRAVPFGVMELAVAASPESATYAALLKKVSTAPVETVPDIATEIRNLLLKVEVPAVVVKEINSSFGPSARLMLRSSANVEDLEEISGAGLYDSLANVANTPTAVANAIRCVWSSLWTRRATLSRRQASIPHEAAHMAVLVQEMITAEISFVMMTTNPLTRDPDEVYVELALGMGETLASGNVRGTPYRLVISKKQKSVRTLALANFSHKLIPSVKAWEGSSAETGSSTQDAGQPASDTYYGLQKELVDYSTTPLSTDEAYRQQLALRISQVGVFIEGKMGGGAQDIEGAVNGDKIYIVQSRPQVQK
mmetsp:Transcript_44263/g.73812  ORF Transcript_44263/g.73812 Transcript_44263/m.73812 type:complete len:1076 (-) Transcript_44263:478-3705(-)